MMLLSSHRGKVAQEEATRPSREGSGPAALGALTALSGCADTQSSRDRSEHAVTIADMVPASLSHRLPALHTEIDLARDAAQGRLRDSRAARQPPSSEPLIIPVPTVARAFGDTHNSSQRPAVSSIQLPTRRRRSLGWVIGEECRRCKSGWMQQLVELARATAHPGIITDRDRDPWKGLEARCGLAQCPRATNFL